MKKRRLFLEGTVLVGISMTVWFFLIYPPSDYALVLHPLATGFPKYVQLVSMKLFPERMGAWGFYLFFSILFNLLLLRILLFFAFKLKWKYAASLLALILWFVANQWAADLCIRIRLKPVWRSYTYGQMGFSIESPYPLRTWFKRGSGRDGRGDYARKELMNTDSFSLISVNAVFTEYGASVPRLEELKGEYGLKPAGTKSFETSKTTASSSSLMDDKAGQCFQMIVVKDGRFRWSFRVSYKNYYQDIFPADTKEMADRVIKSIKILDTPGRFEKVSPGK